MVFWRDKDVKWKDADVSWFPHYYAIYGFVKIANSITIFFDAFANINNFVVRYDNDPRDTPTSGVWMRVSTEFKDSNQAEIGIPTFRNEGSFNVKIKILLGQGIADALSIADIIAAKFRTTIVDETINFQTPRIENVGRVEDNYQVNVICPFFADN